MFLEKGEGNTVKDIFAQNNFFRIILHVKQNYYCQMFLLVYNIPIYIGISNKAFCSNSSSFSLCEIICKKWNVQIYFSFALCRFIFTFYFYIIIFTFLYIFIHLFSY